jgi:hypothetical protein
MKSFLICAALLFSVSAFAQGAPKIGTKPLDPSQTEGARWLQTARLSQWGQSVGRGLYCE